MKKTLLIAIVLFLGVVLGVASYSYLRTQPAPTPTTESNGYLAWCDSIYHQNVGCPQHGKVVIPASVLARQKAEHLAWCDSIGHRNVGCLKFGK